MLAMETSNPLTSLFLPLWIEELTHNKKNLTSEVTSILKSRHSQKFLNGPNWKIGVTPLCKHPKLTIDKAFEIITPHITWP